MRLQGIHVALTSFFNSSGAFDEEALKDHLQFLVEAGVHGFVPCGTTGETPTLSSEEQAKTISLSVEVAKKHSLLVTAGCGSNATDTALELTKKAASLGADAALVVCPYYNKPNAEGLRKHFLHIADKSEIPIVLYNVPSRTVVGLTPELVSELFEHENIIGIKDATGSFSQWLTTAHRCDLEKKALLAGDDNALAPVLSLGGTGIISASANAIPELFVKIYNASVKKDWDSVYSIQKRIDPLVRSLFLESNPTPVKFALSLRRNTSPAVRLPLVETTEGTQGAIKSALKALEVLK